MLFSSFTVFILFLVGGLFFFLSSKTVVYFPILKKYFEFFFIMDWMSLLFLSLLFIITGSVLIFSLTYMSSSPYFMRFHLLLLSFVLSMMVIMISPQSLLLFLGWDGLGIFSFLLVCFYNAKSSWKASLKTYLMNRMGDSLFILLFASVLVLSFWMKEVFLPLFLSLYLILACFTKSAQIPFSSWLPAAMAAPTPVSSLVHSSTLVTAGVYLLFRTHLENSKNILLWMGGLTALLAAVSAAKEFDSKKMVALSTLSNLGMMVFGLGAGCFNQAFFHLLTHAVAKANLFVSVGWLMLNKNHHQDIRLLNSKFWNKMFMKIKLSFSIWSLSGILYFSGFYSKEGMLETFSFTWNAVFLVLFFMTILSSMIYGFRLFFLLSKKMAQSKNFSISKENISFSVMLLFLATFSLGSLLKYSFQNQKFSVFSSKIVIYFFIILSVFMVTLYRNSQSWVANDLFFLQYSSSSFLLNLSKFNQSVMFSFDKVTSHFNNKYKKMIKLMNKTLEFKTLNFSLWSILMILLLII